MNIPEFATVLTTVMRHNMRLHDEGASLIHANHRDRSKDRLKGFRSSHWPHSSLNAIANFGLAFRLIAVSVGLLDGKPDSNHYGLF